MMRKARQLVNDERNKSHIWVDSLHVNLPNIVFPDGYTDYIFRKVVIIEAK